MASDSARQSWATQSWMTESLSSSPTSLSRASSPWPLQLRFSSQASSEFGDYASTNVSIPPSPTSIPLPPASPNELAPPKPVHPIIHLKAELEDILECQRSLRKDSRYVQNRLYGVEYKFGPHLIRAAPRREVAYPSNAVEQDLEKDAIRLEARRQELVSKIAELMNQEINEIKRANNDSGRWNLKHEEELDKTRQDNEAGSTNEREAEKSKNGKGDDESYADAVELQEWQYGDEKEEDADVEEQDFVGKEQEGEKTEIRIQSEVGSQ